MQRARALWLAVMGVAMGAHASSIPLGSYDLTGITVDGYQLTGTVTLKADGIVDAANVELHDAALGDPVFTSVISAGGPAGYAPAADYAYISDAGVGQIELQYLTGADGSGDVELCILRASDCNSYQASSVQIYEWSSLGYNPVDLSSGRLDPVTSGGGGQPAPAAATTPEVGTLALVGTAILGIASLTRKRKRSR